MSVQLSQDYVWLDLHGFHWEPGIGVIKLLNSNTLYENTMIPCKIKFVLETAYELREGAYVSDLQFSHFVAPHPVINDQSLRN